MLTSTDGRSVDLHEQQLCYLLCADVPVQPADSGCSTVCTKTSAHKAIKAAVRETFQKALWQKLKHSIAARLQTCMHSLTVMHP